MPRASVYLDHAATTPVDPRVLAVMLPFFSEIHGNPSSVHSFGQQAEAALERAREQVARVLGCQPAEVIFTASGSESDNLALRGAAFAERRRRGADTLLVSAVEHPAVLKTARQLQQEFGFRLTILPVDASGCVSSASLAEHLSTQVAVVSILYANNEIGTVHALAPLAALCRERGVPFHTDAVQAAGQLPVDVRELGVDLMALGAHKLYGPKGAGVLYVREGLGLLPWLTGGGQEQGRRPGTHNVPLAVGMGEALALTAAERSARNAHQQRLRDRIISAVGQAVAGARLTGHPTERLPNHASFVLPGVDGNALLAGLDARGFACSSGSACKSGTPEPSETLLALGLPRQLALGSLRVTVGKDTDPLDVERFLAVLPEVVAGLRRPAGPE